MKLGWLEALPIWRQKFSISSNIFGKFLDPWSEVWYSSFTALQTCGAQGHILYYFLHERSVHQLDCTDNGQGRHWDKLQSSGKIVNHRRCDGGIMLDRLSQIKFAQRRHFIFVVLKNKIAQFLLLKAPRILRFIRYVFIRYIQPQRTGYFCTSR